MIVDLIRNLVAAYIFLLLKMDNPDLAAAYVVFTVLCEFDALRRSKNRA